MKNLKTYFEAHTDDMVEELRQLVEIESPTSEKAAVDALGAVLAEKARALGATVTFERQTERGDHILARWEGGADQKQLLMLCHMDTVCALGTLEKQPIKIEQGRIYGPGSYDMKGGIVVALNALRGLRAHDMWPARPITILLNSDEEYGAPTSRALIEREALKSELVLVLEPSLVDGSLKTMRKGTGRFVLTATGVAAHAGGEHEKGVNAIKEIAQQILDLEAMTDYERGTTVNVGRVEGGERINIVPERARAWVDIRVTSPEEGERMQAQILNLQPRTPRAQLHVEGELRNPPMPRDETMVKTYARACEIAAELDMTLSQGDSGGASDGNFGAALGVPTLDGLGVVGDGAHARHEHAIISSLPQRAALLAALLMRW